MFQVSGKGRFMFQVSGIGFLFSCLILGSTVLLSCGGSRDDSTSNLPNTNSRIDDSLPVFRGKIHVPTPTRFRITSDPCWVQILNQTQEEILVTSSFFSGEFLFQILSSNADSYKNETNGDQEIYILQIITLTGTKQPVALTHTSKDSKGAINYGVSGSGRYTKECHIPPPRTS